MDKNINPVLVCVDKSEQHPDGIFFSVMLPSGIAAFDVCYNGTVKNVNESVLLTEQIIFYLAKISKSMKVYLENKAFDFGTECNKGSSFVLNCNSPYLKNLIKLLWE